ncbi:hypothetical protein M9H77_12115 [Catharanthus roseus]|uniref:Uncharacterized protein n=1 Tax=Catharanthus roseus TaxID=4058 RepID=A0ACC0BGI0_CATRO|nr:hypothetical protein M9H77_12115 [Catharanthus roseus]
MYNLSTTSASKVYVNINIPEVDAYKTRKTISEFFCIVSDANPEVEKYYTCMVMELSIDMSNDFYYKSCMVCYRKLVEIESKFYCANCSKDVDYPKLRYFNIILFVEKFIADDIETVVELDLKVRFIVFTILRLLTYNISLEFNYMLKEV